MKMYQTMNCLTSQMNVVKILEELPHLLDENIRSFEEEISTLSITRDTLLPKLISDKLRIPDAEKFVEETGV